MERVVVTGMGLVSPLGKGLRRNWSELVQGNAGMFQRLHEQLVQKLPCKYAGVVPEYGQLDESTKTWTFTPHSDRTISRSTFMALEAAQEAIEHSQLPLLDESEAAKDLRINTGVAVGMGISDLEDIALAAWNIENGTPRRISPYFVPRILTNMAAGHISIRHKLHGPNHSVSTACATGNHAIGDSYNFIRNKMANVMVCGGTDACVNPISLAGFSRLRALSTKFVDSPETASRPFDRDRDGFVMGEGAGILILESLTHALKRKATIYAEIIGYGMSGDGHHLTSPDPGGLGAKLCMTRALVNSGIDKKQVNYVNAHATSTPVGDIIEADMINSLFSQCKISSSKGAVGHLLGAAGAAESIFTIMALINQLMPPNRNLCHPDLPDPTKLIGNVAESMETDKMGKSYALANSFGFGGTNASLLFTNWTE